MLTITLIAGATFLIGFACGAVWKAIEWRKRDDMEEGWY